MGKWRLLDGAGCTIRVIEAKDKVNADLHGLKNYPGRYKRCLDVEAEEARHETNLVRLQRALNMGS